MSLCFLPLQPYKTEFISYRCEYDCISSSLAVATHQVPDIQFHLLHVGKFYINLPLTRMWANAQPDDRPAEHRWRPLFKAAKFG